MPHDESMAIRAGFADLSQAWSRRELPLYFAWTETIARYRRSVLGPLWLVFGTAIGVAGLGFVWSILLNSDFETFVPSLTIGLVVWQFLAGCITESAGVFARSATAITNIKSPSFIFSIQLVFRQLINLAHNLVVVVVVFAIFPKTLSPAAFLSIVGLAIVVLNMVSVIQIFGLIGSRYRDLEPLISAFMPIMFFLSPVIFQTRQLGSAQMLLEFNPLAHLIRIVRDPIMGDVPSATSYLVVLALTAVTWLFALWLTGKKAGRLPYWV
ncbi:ABC transporter permease [uncultured Devosia sp.]|uniref:ABC transporter permease n=1 Tax=uncultured Devosia sp. TaxID=211434 RepID=UPI0035C9D060